MAELTLKQAFDLALERHRTGRLPDAEGIYRQILQHQPNNPDALHLLGVIAHQTGRNQEAAELMRRAIALNPSQSDYHSNLGITLLALNALDEASSACTRAIELQPRSATSHFNLALVLQNQGKLAEAAEEFHVATQIDPNMAEAYHNRGNALKAMGQPEAALECYETGLKIAPQFGEAHDNIGLALQQLGKIEPAIAAFRKAIQLRPNMPEPHYNVGVILFKQRRHTEAIPMLRAAIRLKPDLVEAHNNLGLALHDIGRYQAAITSYHMALQRKPDFAEAHYNLANSLKDTQQYEAAVESYLTALRLNPDLAPAHNNLGNAYKDQGEVEKAVECFRRATDLRPDNVVPHSNLIYTLHFLPEYDPQKINQEHARYNERHVEPAAKLIKPHDNDRDPDRKLRLAYVSPDFYQQAEAFFVVPLLKAHDRQQVELHCYSSVRKGDLVTEALRKTADAWHDVRTLSDVELADKIRADRIDVLMDLTMHMAGNRLRTMAHKPAPVQFTWLAYPGTTGVAAIDYRLTDSYMEPPGQDSSWSAELPVRLPDSWCCYDPIVDYPHVNELPAQETGHVTFGSLNNICKFNDHVLDLWSRVLAAVPGSRLIMLCPPGKPQRRIRDAFSARDIAAERIDLVPSSPRTIYLSTFHRIDIGLDPFPYNGITTTCDAMLMGVPVLTLPGASPASRAGLSLLSTVGLQELVATSADDYVKLAADLAGDLPRLAQIRSTLRQKMFTSPLMNPQLFARNVEAAYRQAWKRWCAQ